MRATSASPPGPRSVPLGFGDSVVRIGRHDRERRRLDHRPALQDPALWDAAFSDGERADDSPVGVVGAARIGGEVMNLDIPAQNQVAMMLFLLAGFNLSLFLFSMLRCSRSTVGTSRARCGSRCGATWPRSSGAPTRARSTWPA